MDSVPNEKARLKWEMFALSFTALFLEMMVIRWVPSVVHLVAYYANLMLLSSFLGLGAGAMAAGRRWNLFGWFPVFLAGDIGMLLMDRHVVLGTSSSEAHFFALHPSLFQSFVLIRIFAMNALVFVPLGQRMGVLFNCSLALAGRLRLGPGGQPRRHALLRPLSLWFFSPVVGMAGVMVIYLTISGPRRWSFAIPLFGAVLFAIIWFSDPKAIWSPYYYVTVARQGAPAVSVAPPSPQELKQFDPPLYLVRVNQFGYHYDGTLDSGRYPASSTMRLIELQYKLPYALADGRDRILVVGAGGGFDVQAALECGARHVDAVEIDPAIIRISHQYSAGAPYSDPRVKVINDDARAYLARAQPGYDLVVFGFLDSQALFSTMNNVRLDGYVYTVEGMRSAFRLLNDQGMLAVSFLLGRPWLGPKLYELLAEATGREPALYLDRDTLILCVAKDPHVVLPARVLHYPRISYGKPQMELPTDDCHFLYLIRKTIPSDYLIAIGCLLAFSITAIAWLRRRAFGRGDLHFALLGMGFLLLETKGISDSTLFFGTTWFVTLVVVTGVLLMVIGANLLAERLRSFSSGCTPRCSPSSRSCWSFPGSTCSPTDSPGASSGRSWSSRCPSSLPASSSPPPSAIPPSPRPPLAPTCSGRWSAASASTSAWRSATTGSRSS